MENLTPIQDKEISVLITQDAQKCLLNFVNHEIEIMKSLDTVSLSVIKMDDLHPEKIMMQNVLFLAHFGAGFMNTLLATGHFPDPRLPFPFFKSPDIQ
jgi:hypothetical protein